jgi:hypothetical protein
LLDKVEVAGVTLDERAHEGAVRRHLAAGEASLVQRVSYERRGKTEPLDFVGDNGVLEGTAGGGVPVARVAQAGSVDAGSKRDAGMLTLTEIAGAGGPA